VVDESWKTLADDAYEAADALYRGGYWRSAISRAYYAGYARATIEVIDAGQTMPTRGNPGHEQLQHMVLHSLTRLSAAHRTNCHAMLAALFWRRVVADYEPDFLIDRRAAFEALGWMASLFRSMDAAN